MITINLKSGQGLGNQLWNIFAAKQISLNNNCQLTIGGFSNFKGSDFIKFKCKNIYQESFYTDFIINEDLFYDKKLKYINSGYDPKFKKLKPPFEIQGLFQDERYITPLIQSPQDFISIDYERLQFSNNTCVLNIRGGEFKRTRSLILPKKYWYDAIKLMQKKYSINEFVVVTDDPYYAKSIFPHFPIISNSVKKCFNAIMQARFVVTSNSSFSYFPIALSAPKEVVLAPKYMMRHKANDTWCSIGNIYDNYTYIDVAGMITTSDENLSNTLEARDLYRKNTVLVSTDDIFETGYKKYVGKQMRHNLKKFLHILSPSRF